MRYIKLLIIDDEPGFYSLLRKTLTGPYDFETASTPERGLGLLGQGGWNAVLLDLTFQGSHAYEDGLNKILPQAIKLSKGAFPIIVTTSDNAEKTEVIARQHGAAGFLRKSQYDIDFWDHRIREIIAEFKKRKEIKTKPQSVDLAWEDKFVSAAPEMEAIKIRLRKLVNYPHSPVLLLGETGVGKEVAAKYLHDAKNNPKLPFKAVNLSAFNPNLVESEMFGHTADAFTGAQKEKKGFFEEAKGGTLFLDEVGEISLELQTKLLRVIQERKFQKVGSTHDIELDAHLVFATNRNLDEDVATGRFRQDFYERIKTITIPILPLRERRADILPLIERFLKKLCVQPYHPLYEKKAEECFTKAALEALQQYYWPSNVRELHNAIQELLFEVDVRDLKIIDADILPIRFKSEYIPYKPPPQPQAQDIIPPSKDFVQAPIFWSIAKQTAYNELEQIEKTLIQEGGRKDEAAKALGMKDDQLLRYKVKTKYFNEYPELFDDFPIITKVYKLKFL